ncbi:MAG: ParB/RepB/Spo0J family partition protein [Ruminococcaceae bacterium]|nr:ParB/RepB/Spo0J family partition protein [Oscillospiraceae bacterium]
MNAVNIDMKKLHPFEGHPYQVQDNEEMDTLVESVQAQGVLTPLIVRPKENTTDEYEIVSGHRRFRAAKKAGMNEVPAFIYEMDRDAAAIALVDSNLHREHLLPSEKAFAYRLKMEAMKRQGFRSDLTSTQVVAKLRSGDIVGQGMNEGRETVRRYIRLTNLIPEILQKVDEGRIAFTPAVELSYLTHEEQKHLASEMDYADATPNLSQAQRMREFSRQGRLSEDVICAIMGEEKANQKEKLKIPMDRIRKFFPRSYTTAQMETEIVKLCEAQYRRRQRSREER